MGTCCLRATPTDTRHEHHRRRDLLDEASGVDYPAHSSTTGRGGSCSSPIVGDFNVDKSDRSTKDWLVQHMAIRYSLRCISLDHLVPTTVRGSRIDIVFANIPLKPVLEPLAVHFSDHNSGTLLESSSDCFHPRAGAVRTAG
ncbi:hypothetical protein HPB50_027270 [Hyalomma asiaticum]|uniref:Uncharacterized protein n=1 Tax=Hyalomma asiaticum TaxID=266040 RepID=A0ACB7TRI8_HYAAI|nr:hypothetical protein HPB50_027270 [Hyalomma asiaticum]